MLLLTFTRRAADEMLARAAAMCTRRDAARDCRAARSTRSPTGWSPAHRGAGPAAGPLGARPGRRHRPDGPAAARPRPGGTEPGSRAATLLDIYSRAVNTGRPARDVIAAEFRWVEPHVEQVMELFRGLCRPQAGARLLDFDDLLLAWRACCADPVLGPAIAGRWDHVLVDEYQDVNQIQVDIVRALRPDGPGLTVVGDDAQAVYGFRGADSAHLLDLSDACRTSPSSGWSTTSGPGNGCWTWPTRSGRIGRRAPTAAAVRPRRRPARPVWSAAMTRRPRPGRSSTRC